MQFSHAYIVGKISPSDLLAGRDFVYNSENIWAFLDMNNLNRAVQEYGWKVDWRLFRGHLAKKYNVTKAIAFMGYIPEFRYIYRCILNGGFSIKFRKVNKFPNGKIDGGNCDCDLTGYAMNYKNDYDKAIIIADDADYCNTLKLLKRQNKLKLIISSHSIEQTSQLIKEKIGINFIQSIQSLRPLIEYKPFYR